MRIYVFIEKKLWGKVLSTTMVIDVYMAICTYRFLQIIPFIQWIYLETKLLPFCAPCLFDYLDFLSLAWGISFQRFNAGKLWEML